MASLVAFFEAPSRAFVDGCKKEQLIKIAQHYSIEVSANNRKDDLKQIILSALVQQGILQESVLGAAESMSIPVSAPPMTQMSGFSFEQQKEMLVMQLELEKLRQQDRDKDRRLECEKFLELEKIRHSTERMKLELEHSKLQLIMEGKLSCPESDPGSSALGGVDIISDLRLVPKFNERDPDIFFILFERIAEAGCWSDANKVLLLQCVLTGRAQEAYSAICGEANLGYEMIKSAVLKSYDLVPEAYRQKFRNWVKGNQQSNVEFVRDLTSHFKRWCTAANVNNFDDLGELIVLEQYTSTAYCYVCE